MLIERLRFTSLSRIFRRKIVVMIIWGIRPQASERIMNCWGRNICREWSADRRIYDSITIKCKQQNQKKSPGSTMKRSWNFIGGAVWNASISGTATVRRAGFEPAVSCVSDRRSNHLNYLRCFRKESNLPLLFRKQPFFPLYFGSETLLMRLELIIFCFGSRCVIRLRYSNMAPALRLERRHHFHGYSWFSGPLPYH